MDGMRIGQNVCIGKRLVSLVSLVNLVSLPGPGLLGSGFCKDDWIVLWIPNDDLHLRNHGEHGCEACAEGTKRQVGGGGWWGCQVGAGWELGGMVRVRVREKWEGTQGQCAWIVHPVPYPHGWNGQRMVWNRLDGEGAHHSYSVVRTPMD